MAKNKIRAYLYGNTLTAGGAGGYIARAEIMRPLNVKAVCESAAARGGADISAAAMEHAVALFQKEAAYLIVNGFAVNTGLYHAAASIRGIFDSPDETFTRGKHHIDINFTQGGLFGKEIDDVEVDVRGIADTEAHIAQVVDVRTGSVNGAITPAYNVRITGVKLKIAGSDERNGVYFVSEADPGARTLVPKDDIVNNKPSELVVRCPDNLKGRYKLEVVTQYGSGGNRSLKEPRTAVFDKVLTVGA